MSKWMSIESLTASRKGSPDRNIDPESVDI
jgi:hypothetical protein